MAYKRERSPVEGLRRDLSCRSDHDADNIFALRIQHLSRVGISPALAAIVAPLAFGEVAR